jgi:hypothetical protein
VPTATVSVDAPDVAVGVFAVALGVVEGVLAALGVVEGVLAVVLGVTDVVEGAFVVLLGVAEVVEGVLVVLLLLVVALGAVVALVVVLGVLAVALQPASSAGSRMSSLRSTPLIEHSGMLSATAPFQRLRHVSLLQNLARIVADGLMPEVRSKPESVLHLVSWASGNACATWVVSHMFPCAAVSGVAAMATMAATAKDFMVLSA